MVLQSQHLAFEVAVQSLDLLFRVYSQPDLSVDVGSDAEEAADRTFVRSRPR